MRSILLSALSPAPSTVPGPKKVPENPFSNECMGAAPHRVSVTMPGKLALHPPSAQQERGFEMTNVHVDKLESTSHPEFCFAINKGQRGGGWSLANICQEPRI